MGSGFSAECLLWAVAEPSCPGSLLLALWLIYSDIPYSGRLLASNVNDVTIKLVQVMQAN